jgi:ATP-binding protein involved in chromosome partitioning
MAKALSKESVLAALRKVQEPELHKDLVSLNMIQDIQINGKKVSFKIVLTTPACPLRSRIESEARQAVLDLPGVSEVDLQMEANVPSDGRTRSLASLPIRNAIAIGSGKGGVGKSTVSVNVAVVLAKSGACVGLLDADIYGPNIPTMMGVQTQVKHRDNMMIPEEAHGVKLMSIGFLVKPGQPIVWRGPMLHTAIQQFLSQVDWGELDYLIVDLPPGTGDAALSLSQSLPLSGAVIVTMPQQVSLDDASRNLGMFRMLGVPIIGVVENMSYLELPDGTRMDVFGSGGGERLAYESNVPFLGQIPLDPIVRIGGDSGMPVTLTHPDSPSARALYAVTETIAARVSVAAMQR